MHKFNTFIVESFELKSEEVVEVNLLIDGECISFPILKKDLGYKVTGDLQNLATQCLRRSQSFVTLLDNHYNNLPVNLPVDLTFSEDFQDDNLWGS